jgi:putative heme-binding domain-containing protein
MPLPCPGGHRHFLIVLALPVLLVPAFFVQPCSFAAEPAKPVRTPWTTSQVVGSPDPPPPFKVVRVFPNLKFKRPLLLARCPESDRLFVGEEAGVLYSFPNHQDATADLFFDLRKELKTLHLLPEAKELESVYGLAFHPDFEKNRQCFVCYTLRAKDPRVRNLKEGTRVSRFTVIGTEPPRIDPASEEIVLTFLQGGHNGGDIHFGPDGMLYISTGDAASPNPPDELNTGQDISDLLSSILRIDVDRKDDGKNFAVPKDNPFVGMKEARPEVWAYGFRNPWRMSFDRQTGELFVGDVGWELWEMVHRVEKGGNYGWAATEGPQPIKAEQVGPTPIHPALIELPHTIACSVTGGFVYRGRKFPELHGAYVFGDWETRRLWAARFQGDQTQEMPEIARPSVRIVAFGEDRDGELYFLDHDHGTIHTLERNNDGAENADFPTKLSQSGLFSSVERHKPADGVMPFTINSRQWQDGATAEHWVAFPGVSSALLHATGKPIPGLVYWHNFRMHFPKDAVLMRTLSLGARRLETQMLHYDGVDWRAYTYAWRDDQSDADLVPGDGAEKEVRDGQRDFVWQFHSRSQCMSCHSNQSEYALAFVPEQLNRPGPDGRNQLIALTEAGFIRRAGNDGELLPPFDIASAAQERKIADPTDGGEPLEARARAYLHANCGHCHSEHGGGSVPLRLQFPVPVAKMQAVGVGSTRGDFGLPDAAIIKPGEPYASTLYFRMAKFGRDRMPHIGSEWPDEAGLKLVEQWIVDMNGGAEPTDVRLDGAAPDQLLVSPQSALLLARKLGRGELNRTDRESLLTAAAKLPPGPIRDLFEGYLPSGEQGARKLGSNPRPAAILALKGDASRGEKLFWSQAINCGKCHRVGDRGTPIGPDLSSIGRLRSTDDLLESLLSPSRRIEPKYAAYLVHTGDGRSLTGLLVKRDESSVVLRDNEGKEIILAAENVEELRPLRTSLMPEGQVAGLMAQEAADLLEYLATQKYASSPPTP